MDAELEQKIAVFFAHPLIAQEDLTGNPPNIFGVLYLLRRDCQGCLNQGHYLFPATMTMFAGIDLLAKFYAGDDKGEVGTRFKSFINAYFGADIPPDATLPIEPVRLLEPGDAGLLWALRNALMHSFGLYTRGKKITLAEHVQARWVVTERDGTYIIGIHRLYEWFEYAIDRYHQDLLSRPDLQANFARMYTNYGTTMMGKGTL